MEIIRLAKVQILNANTMNTIKDHLISPRASGLSVTTDNAFHAKMEIHSQLGRYILERANILIPLHFYPQATEEYLLLTIEKLPFPHRLFIKWTWHMDTHPASIADDIMPPGNYSLPLRRMSATSLRLIRNLILKALLHLRFASTVLFHK